MLGLRAEFLKSKRRSCDFYACSNLDAHLIALIAGRRPALVTNPDLSEFVMQWIDEEACKCPLSELALEVARHVRKTIEGEV